jgi:hypothetical protein
MTRSSTRLVLRVRPQRVGLIPVLASNGEIAVTDTKDVEQLMEIIAQRFGASSAAISRIRHHVLESEQNFAAVKSHVEQTPVGGSPSSPFSRFLDGMAVNNDLDEFGGDYRETSGGNYKKL